MKILIDTDIGGDVDDAVALALAIKSKELDIIGISLVYIANQWRAGILQNMLQVYNREDIPYVIGAEKPLIGTWGDNPNLENNRAAEFIIKICDENPDAVLVPIGPLTNIAAAFLAAPRIAIHRKIMLMGGTWGEQRAEWNIQCDPEAADIVINSGADISMVGLNVTELCQFTQEEVDMFKTGLLNEMIHKFILDYKYLPILHDPLAVAGLIWNDLIVFEEKNIAINPSGILINGKTAVNIAVSVNHKLFKKRLIERIC